MKNNDIGKGIATAGVWLGVGLASIHGGEWIAAVAASAMFATLFIWG